MRNSKGGNKLMKTKMVRMKILLKYRFNFFGKIIVLVKKINFFLENKFNLDLS